MRKFFILAFSAILLWGCTPGVLTKPVTVDFTGYESDHMIVTFSGSQHQGVFIFNVDNGSVQTKNMPRHGKYAVSLSINPEQVSSCDISLDVGSGSLTLSEAMAGSVSITGVTLLDNYGFTIQCRKVKKDARVAYLKLK